MYSIGHSLHDFAIMIMGILTYVMFNLGVSEKGLPPLFEDTVYLSNYNVPKIYATSVVRMGRPLE